MLAWIRRAVGFVLEARQRGAALRELAALSDRDMRDLGLRREQLADLLTAPKPPSGKAPAETTIYGAADFAPCG